MPPEISQGSTSSPRFIGVFHPRGRLTTATLALCLFSALPNPLPLAGQEATLQVNVLGPAGPLSGVPVDLLSGGEISRSSLSGLDGAVLFQGLPPGNYRIRIEYAGHAPFLSDAVALSAGDRRVVEARLVPNPVELQGITVLVDPIQIQRGNTEFATRVSERALELLPVAYDVGELVALTPGARAENVWGGANFQANSYQIDGLSANNPGLGGSLFEPSPNWVQEVEVRGLGAGAEHGGFQGGQVNVITKSGENAFSGMLRTTLSSHLLSSSNLVLSEIGSEAKDRVDVDGEVRGAFLPDRLFYYVGGTFTNRTANVLNHVNFDGRYLPVLERQSEKKVFGKLTWSPTPMDRIDLSGAFLGNDVQNFELTGYEGPGATSDYHAPTWFGNLNWRRMFSGGAVLEARLNRFQQDGRTDPAQGDAVPGVRLYALTPPFSHFENAPLSLRSASSSSSLGATISLPFELVGEEHSVKMGVEASQGGFLDRRTRNGGMTWMPAEWDGLDPEDAATWANPEDGYIPTEWGGEVNLDSDVLNAAAFTQASLSFGRLVLTPGVRWGMWKGWVNPASGARFKAVEDRAMDLRVGAILELTEEGNLVLKGHWGRYHQDLIGQMFDRAGGADSFSNQEIWNYHGGSIPSPAMGFTQAERDALAEGGVFTKESVISLNETGPTVRFRQPFVDQWLVGLERQFGNSVKFEALYTRRANRNMVALVDRNRDANFTPFERVRVHMGGPGGTPLPYGGTSILTGSTVVMPELYVPNNVVLGELRWCAANPGECQLPPGLTLADTASLSWNPDYVLTTAPGAEREFWQLQLGIEISRPQWGGALSFVWTGLEGNLDNVSGYADPAEFGPGPYVRLNEGVNGYGPLPNFADKEGKISAWGELPLGFRGGAFLTFRGGDHYSPQFRISAQRSHYGYRANAEGGRSCYTSDPQCVNWGGDALPNSFIVPLEGQNVFIGTRGNRQTESFSNLDLRLERVVELSTFSLGFSMDLFNAWGVAAVTQIQPLLNNGQRLSYYRFESASTDFRKLWAGKWFGSPLARAAPRRLRLGTTVYF